jgi:hypothetical protein
LFDSVQNGSGDHQAFYPVGTGVKRAGRGADHPPPNIAVRKTWIYTFTLPYSFIVRSLISKYRENFIFTFFVATTVRKSNSTINIIFLIINNFNNSLIFI